MIVLKYLLEFLGFAMLAAAAALVAMDLIKLYRQPRPELRNGRLDLEWRLPALGGRLWWIVYVRSFMAR